MLEWVDMPPFKARSAVFQWDQLKKRGFHLDEFLFAYLLVNGFTRHEAKVQGVTLHWLQKSSQNPKKWVILVHGIASTSSHWTHTAIDLVKRGYSVIALDLPCHGRSADPHDLDSPKRPKACTPDYFFGLFSEWMSEVAPKITGSPYHLVGNSLGGGMCLRFALESPEVLKSLMLISPAGGFESKQQWEDFRENLQFKTSKDLARARDYIERIYHRPPIYTFALAKPFMKAMSEGGLQEMVALSNYENAAIISAEKGLRTLEMPTLIIWGKSEKLFPRTHLENFKKHLKSSASLAFEEPAGIGHVPQLEKPRWLNERIDRFLSQN